MLHASYPLCSEYYTVSPQREDFIPDPGLPGLQRRVVADSEVRGAGVVKDFRNLNVRRPLGLVASNIYAASRQCDYQLCAASSSFLRCQEEVDSIMEPAPNEL